MTNYINASRRLRSVNIFENVVIICVYLLCAVIAVLSLPAKTHNTMIFYMIAMSLSVLFAYFAQPKDNARLRAFPLLISFLILFFVLGFRDLSGVDDHSYLSIFNQVREKGVIKYFLQSTMEPGYLLLNWITGKISGDYRLTQIVCTFIPVFLFYKSFARYRTVISIPLAVLLLCSTLYFQMLAISLVRMFIGVSIVFYAIGYIWTLKPLKYMTAIIIATLFHYSAIIMLPFVFLAYSKEYISLHWKKACVIAVVLIPAVVLFVVRFWVPLMGARYAIYEEISEMSLGFSFANKVILFICAVVFIKKIPQDFKNHYLLGAVLLFLTSSISLFSGGIIGRCIYYGNLGLLISFPLLYRHSTNQSLRFYVAVGVIVYAFWYAYATQWSNNIMHMDHLFPYRNMYFTI